MVRFVALGVIAVAVACLYVWSRRYRAALTPQQQAQQDDEIAEITRDGL